MFNRNGLVRDWGGFIDTDKISVRELLNQVEGRLGTKTLQPVGLNSFKHLENYQQKDGSVVAPEVLREFVGEEEGSSNLSISWIYVPM